MTFVSQTRLGCWCGTSVDLCVPVGASVWICWVLTCSSFLPIYIYLYIYIVYTYIYIYIYTYIYIYIVHLCVMYCVEKVS